MEPEKLLEPISLHPKAYRFFPKRIDYLIKGRRKSRVLKRREPDIILWGRSSMTNTNS